jgi:hypothetical protein
VSSVLRSAAVKKVVPYLSRDSISLSYSRLKFEKRMYSG